MDENKRPIVRRPDVLRKLNAENLLMIERGILGDLPDRLKPYRGPVRGQANELVVARPQGFLSACLPVVPDSPTSEKLTSSDDETVEPLKKSFSFRDRFSRISFLSKHKDGKDKTKWKTIVEDEKAIDSNRQSGQLEHKHDSKEDHDLKSQRRFWFFRNKEMMEKKEQNSRPAYKRSKSYEFLPKAIEEGTGTVEYPKKPIKNNLSYMFGSSDTMGEAWTSNESLEFVSNVYDNDDSVFLKSIRKVSPDSSKNNSSLSTATSTSSGLVVNIFNRESVQNLLEEFDKAVDLFSENYSSDCEPYTKTEKERVKENRKSASFSTLPSPKVIQAAKVSEVSEDFKKELTRMLSEKRASAVRSARRGSVTDWFVLEDQAAAAAAASEQNKYRRAQRKPINRVRRMSSTKYVST